MEKNAVQIIKDFRKEFGLSRRQVAAILGITRDIVANWENDRTKVPADELLKLYAWRDQRLKSNVSA